MKTVIVVNVSDQMSKAAGRKRANEMSNWKMVLIRHEKTSGTD
ncbi:MAG: hypothetical protein ACM3MK_08770 [Chitinophagales bacterium]